MYSNILIRAQKDSGNIAAGSVSYEIITQICSHVDQSMKNAFSAEKVTILFGNGWYYKYIPEGISNNDVNKGDDGYIYTNIGSGYWRAYYVVYDKEENTDIFTGHIYVFAQD